MKDLVSVIIPTHNRSDLLLRGINSILEQTYKAIEIIIIDDGSKDNTESVVKDLQKNYSNIVYLKHEKPRGAPAARNFGIRKARGEFITFLDDDDEMLAEKIKLMRTKFKVQFAYVATGYFEINSKRKKKIIPPEVVSYRNLLYNYKLGGGNQMFTLRERIIAVKGFDEKLKAFQDYDFWLRISEKYGNGYCIQKPLSIIHMEHEEGRITTSNKRFHGAMSFYNKHKNKMTNSQRKFQLFHLMRLKNKGISLKMYIAMVPLKYYYDTYRYYLAKNIPIFGHLKRKLFD